MYGSRKDITAWPGVSAEYENEAVGQKEITSYAKYFKLASIAHSASF